MEQAEGCWSRALGGLGVALPLLSQHRTPLPWGLAATRASRSRFGEPGCPIFWDAGHGNTPHLCRAGMLVPRDAAALKHPKKFLQRERERKEEERRKGVFQNLMEEVGAPGGAPAPSPAPIPKGEGLEG